MRRCLFLLSIFLLLGLEAPAQQKDPPEPPPPRGDATPTPTPPPAPPPTVIVAPPTKSNGKIQKSLVRITATEVGGECILGETQSEPEDREA